MSDTEPNTRERRFVVDQNFDGWRLDQFICNRIPRLTRTRARDIAKHGDVELEPFRKAKASTKLRVGDVVIVREHLPPETVDDDAIVHLYEDDRILALYKTSGMLVHETASVRLNTVQMYLERAGFLTAEPGHRIDRETSGVLLCGKDKEAVIALRKMFATDHPDKVYRALVLDRDRFWSEGETVTLDIPLGLDPEGDLRVRMVEGDLSAVTHVHVLQRRDELVDLRVTIETGRQHQIRVHLALAGTPIAGDKLYTFDDAFFKAITDNPEDPELLAKLHFPRHALHAWRLTFSHPFEDETVTVEAPLPDFWSTFI